MYANPYTWTDTSGEEHTMETHCTNQESSTECQTRHDEFIAECLEEWPEA
jgi:hypothetical protein